MTITKAALKAATTRFKRVLSLIRCMVAGPRLAAAIPLHENHEPSFMMGLIRGMDFGRTIGA